VQCAEFWKLELNDQNQNDQMMIFKRVEMELKLTQVILGPKEE